MNTKEIADELATSTRNRKKLKAIDELVSDCPELNLNNYDEEDVRTLNNTLIGIFKILINDNYN